MIQAPEEAPVAQSVDVTLQIDHMIEVKLNEEIQSLWIAHRQRKTTAQQTKEELQVIRRDLGQRLSEMKTVLARTGRGGGWASYLRSASLPRASADRYVRQHEAMRNPSQTKRLSESISEPTEDDTRRLVRNLLPKLRKVLTTSESVSLFVREVVRHFEREVDGIGSVAEGGSSPQHAVGVSQQDLQHL